MCSIHDNDDDLAASNVVQRSRALYAEVPVRAVDDPAGAYIGLTRGKVPANEAARAESGPAAGEIPGGAVAAPRITAPAAPRPLAAPPRPGPRYHVEDSRAPGRLLTEARAKGLVE